jgi:hypothetical protein
MLRTAASKSGKLQGFELYVSKTEVKKKIDAAEKETADESTLEQMKRKSF